MWDKDRKSLTDKQAGVHVGVFAQQLLADVYCRIILVLNAQQDLVLQQKEGAEGPDRQCTISLAKENKII